MAEPNFFIAGAPRCGTTSMYRYLSEHPNIFMPEKVKEPHFFAEDFAWYQKRFTPTISDYQALFQGASELHKAVGEASVFYMFSSVALDKIRAFSPDARIIVMLRNPVDLVRSMHARHLYTFFEDEKDFETAWRLQSQRKAGQSIPPTCPVPEVLQYADVAMLGRQMERLYSHFPAKQVHMIFFEDFLRDTRSCYQGVLDFLGIQDDGRLDFQRINAGRTDRSRLLSRLLRSPPFPLGTVKKRLREVGGRRWERLRDSLLQLVTKQRGTSILSVELREELAETFRDDVARLGECSKRDVSGWLNQKQNHARAKLQRL